MAHAVRACSLALVFVILLLFVKAKIDECQRGNVTVKPSRLISLGSSVNISCSLKPKQGCSPYSSFNQLILYQFKNRIHIQHGDSLSSQVTGLSLGTTVFVCKLACSKSTEIRICGADVLVGVVPEQPQNLSCIQNGEHGTVTCTWERGRNTHLFTTYTLQLNGPKNLTWQKQCNGNYCDRLNLGINLIPESSESNYTAKVMAVNKLGSASSFPSVFTFLDIVRPLPPWDIRIRFVNDSVRRCILQWKDEELVQFNRLRYRPVNSTFWNMVNATNVKGRHDLLDLMPFAMYEFQISSKIHLYKGSWSNWSESLRTQTPEEEPTGMLDVWYMKQHIDYNTQQISLFWKNLNVSEARGKIHYWVSLHEVTGGKTTLQNITENTSWTWIIPRTGNWTVTVSAANSKGSSLPTRINITDLCGQLLAPHQVSASPEGLDNIMVSWEPPAKTAPAVQEYVVEWRELHPGGSTESPLNWLRSPPYNMSTLISENIKPYICYEFHVYALSGDQGGCSSIRGDAKHKAPLNGPHINAITAEKGGVLISWHGIPAQEQMGCILRYRIYWREQNSDSQTHLCGKADWIAYLAPSICIAVITVGIFSHVSSGKRQLLSFQPSVLSAVAEKFQTQQTACGQKVSHCRGEDGPFRQAPDSLVTSEEPEPLVINEVLNKGIPVIRPTHRSNWSEGQEVQGHCTSEEDTGYCASSPPHPRALTTETQQQVDLYKVLGCRALTQSWEMSP